MESHFWTAYCKHCKTYYRPFENGRAIVAVQCCGSTIVLHAIHGATERTAEGHTGDVMRKSEYARRWTHKNADAKGWPAFGIKPKQVAWRQSKRVLRQRKGKTPRLTTKIAK